MLPRLALTLGGLLALFLTPAFSLSYFLSFGVEYDESPPGWLAQLQEPLLDAGLLEPAGSTYSLYGRLYLGACVLALAGLVGLLRREWSQFTPRLRRAWAVLLIGLGLVTLGILGEYGATTDSLNTLGFGFTILGVLGAVAGCGLLGWALRRDRRVSTWTAVGVSGFGVVSAVGGYALVSHIPSGLVLGFVGAAIVLGLAGPRTQASRVSG